MESRSERNVVLQLTTAACAAAAALYPINLKNRTQRLFTFTSSKHTEEAPNPFTPRSCRPRRLALRPQTVGTCAIRHASSASMRLGRHVHCETEVGGEAPGVDAGAKCYSFAVKQR
jgi:hypothetical protein